jgi:hypothetical protein
MKTGYSKLSYSLAIIAGFFLPLTAYLEPAPYAFAMICLLLGGIFGYFWPKESWRWGLWISGPSIAFIILSIAFAGQLKVFLEKDLPVILTTLIASSVGSFLLALIAIKQAKSKS